MKNVFASALLMVSAAAGALDISLAHRNDGLGLGLSAEWDDFETYAFELGVDQGRWSLDTTFASLTSRELDLRIDELSNTLEYDVPLGLGFSMTPGVGLDLLGQFGGRFVQEEWHHDVARVTRPVPQTYESVEVPERPRLSLITQWSSQFGVWEPVVRSTSDASWVGTWSQDISICLPSVPGLEMLGLEAGYHWGAGSCGCEVLSVAEQVTDGAHATIEWTMWPFGLSQTWYASGWSRGTARLSTALKKKSTGDSLLSMGSALTHTSSWTQASRYIRKDGSWAVIYRSHFGYLPHDDPALAYRETAWFFGVERAFPQRYPPFRVIPYLGVMVGPRLRSEYVMTEGPAVILSRVWGAMGSAGSGLRLGLDLGPVIGLDVAVWTFWPDGGDGPDWRLDLGFFARS